MITPEQLKHIDINAGTKLCVKYVPFLNDAMAQYEINTIKRKAAFVANVLHESDHLIYMQEIASGQAYEGRKDLGNTQKGDGVRFKGRGPIQVTGRENYTLIAKAFSIDCVNHPELLEDPKYGFLASAWWWKMKGLNDLADTGRFKAVVATVNGGYNGLEERTLFYNNALSILK